MKVFTCSYCIVFIVIMQNILAGGRRRRRIRRLFNRILCVIICLFELLNYDKETNKYCTYINCEALKIFFVFKYKLKNEYKNQNQSRGERAH